VSDLTPLGSPLPTQDCNPREFRDRDAVKGRFGVQPGSRCRL